MRDYRKFCRPKTIKNPRIGDYEITLNCGNSVFAKNKDFLRIMKFFKHYSIYGAEESSVGKLKVSIPGVDEEIFISSSNYQPDFELLEIVGEEIPSHDYVEIGGIKWATMNIGANSVTDSGLYFQWGDTQGYTADQVGSGSGLKAFTWEDYKFNPSGDGRTFTKYNGTDYTVLQASDDAITAAWGNGWRMPTSDEFVRLGNAVTRAWTDDYQGSGVAGLVLTDKNNSSKVLFFPAAGFAEDGNIYDINDDGLYLSSSLNSDGVSYAYYLYFDSDYVNWDINNGRYYGYPVRGIFSGTIGNIIAHNNDLDRDVIFSYENWLQLDNSWTFKGILGVDTFTEETAENGYYIIQDDNGFTTIIKSDDLTKVQDNWEFVEVYHK